MGYGGTQENQEGEGSRPGPGPSLSTPDSTSTSSTASAQEHRDPRKRRVLILGGGLAGLATAYGLSRTQELRDAFEVTVLQAGWRLGGKCASGRNEHMGYRIEEHGLHVWFGCYDNAFALLRDCYGVADWIEGAPFSTIDEAFLPDDEVVLWDLFDGKWTACPARYRRNDESPGIDIYEHDFWTLVRNMARHLEEAWSDISHVHADVGDMHAGWIARLGQWMDLKAEEAKKSGLGLLFHRLSDFAHTRTGQTSSFCKFLEAIREVLDEHLYRPYAGDPKVRHFCARAETMITMFIGLISDEVLSKGFSQLDDEDFRQWLRRHGASESTLTSPWVRAWYDGAFAYLGGDKAKPNVAAGASLKAILRQQLAYRGAFAWKMAAGMGETVIAPIYLALKRRGVEFRFYSQVTDLVAAKVEPGLGDVVGKVEPGLGDVVGKVILNVQARTEGQFDPLIQVGGLWCWPSEPDFSQLVDGETLRQSADIQAMDFGSGEPMGVPVELNYGEDFDDVVLAISVGALDTICAGLWPPATAEASKGATFASNTRDAVVDRAMELMIAKSETTMTQSFQVWTRRKTADLGWAYGPSLTSTYVEPVDTYCDMSHLIAREVWTSGASPGGVGYFCGVMPDPQPNQQSASERVKSTMTEFLESNMGQYWPAVSAEGVSFNQELFDPDGSDNGNGNKSASVSAQYWRANWAPTERYVLTPAGSTRFRLGPSGSGFSNLYLAGDWTANGLNLGCVEAAVMSGLEAARVLSGSHAYIPAESDRWLSLG